MEQDFQQELLDIFQQEAEDYLAVLRNGIQSLEEQPAPETIEEIFRTTHSLKG
ncbi:MAG: Hpt domain-containing protein, partial [Caldisericaceae bacterium]|nr:Hpt domain-containing protein [Caldisericaceae bacterium]